MSNSIPVLKDTFLDDKIDSKSICLCDLKFQINLKEEDFSHVHFKKSDLLHSL